jgi:hypothetical protein
MNPGIAQWEACVMPGSAASGKQITAIEGLSPTTQSRRPGQS